MRSKTRFRSLRLEALETRDLLATVPGLIAGGPTGVAISGELRSAVIGNTLYFAGYNDATGDELWKTDGTVAGTKLVKDIRPRRGNESNDGHSNPSQLTNVNGTLFFGATLGNEHWGLFRSDGTAQGTMLLKEVLVVSATEVNGQLFFVGSDEQRGYELWKSDGTIEGTVLVKDIRPGPESAIRFQSKLANVNGIVFFEAHDGVNGYELWKSDGTGAGTQMVRDISAGSASSQLRDLIALNGRLCFTANKELWISDGTKDGTSLVRKIHATSSSNVGNVVLMNGVLYFAARDGVTSEFGTELWRSDGTFDGTFLVKDLTTGAEGGNPLVGSSPGQLTPMNGMLYFTAADELLRSGRLWKTDGTAAGTVLVRSNVNASQLLNVDGTLYFRDYDPEHGYELWKSDGSTAGTMRVRDIAPGAQDSGASPAVGIGKTLYFVADDGVDGNHLWKSDGTAAGTAIVGRESLSFFPGELEVVGEMGYFTAMNTSHGAELWRTDGTPGGTTLVKDIYLGPEHAAPRHLAATHNRLFFSASDGVHGTELWVSDGTAAGTHLVKDIISGTGSSYPEALINVGGKIYFRAIGPNRQTYEVWRSDGTAEGTLLLLSVPFGHFYKPDSFTDVNGILFFKAATLHSSQMLWRSDGTVSGTFPLDFGGFGPTNLTNVNGTLFFSAAANGPGQELWKSDGTAIGTVLVKDIVPGANTSGGNAGSDPHSLTNVNGTLYFVANDPIHGGELWRSDGTEAGTTMVTEIYPGPDTFNSPRYLTSFAGMVFFGAYSDDWSLWKSDGTAGGTMMVQRVHAQSLVVRNNKLYFVGIESVHGGELWTSDGTAAGTAMVGDLAAGFPSSSPDSISSLGRRIIFSAKNGVHSRQLWALMPGISVFAEDGPQTFVDWAQNLFPPGLPISSFSTTADRSELFAEQPRIDEAGNLEFTPAPNSQGKTRVTVVRLSEAEGEQQESVEGDLTAVFEIEIVQRAPWQNDSYWADGNDDGDVTARDILLVIDYINSTGVTDVGTDSSGPFYDTSGDNRVTALDALLVINIINAFGTFLDYEELPEEDLPDLRLSDAEGEAVLPKPAIRASQSDSDLFALLATDLAELTTARKKRI